MTKSVFHVSLEKVYVPINSFVKVFSSLLIVKESAVSGFGNKLLINVHSFSVFVFYFYMLRRQVLQVLF